MSRLEKLNNTKKSSNLIHERTREEKEPKKRSGFLRFIIITILGSLVYFVFFSGALNISSTEVRGYSNPALVEGIVAEYLKGYFDKNILLFDSASVSEVIKDDSGVRSVKVKKVLPNKILVEITESTGAMNLNTAGESFVIDERGYVIDKNNNTSLPQVYDNANIQVSLGERVASPTFIKYILDLSESFEPIVGVTPEKIIIYDIFSDVHVKSSAGWTVYLDSTKDPVKQLENLARVLREAKEEGHKNLSYIDMRLDNKVYYK